MLNLVAGRQHSAALDRVKHFLSYRLGTLSFTISVAIVLIAFAGLRSSEPSYGGQDLRLWLVALQSTNLAQRAEAEAAVRAIGTNAIPTLLTWLSHLDSEQEERLTQWLAKHGVSTGHRFSENYYRSKALCGFRALGTNSQGAVPALRALSTDPARGFHAAVALIWASPGEAQALADMWATNANASVKMRGLQLRNQIAVQ